MKGIKGRSVAAASCGLCFARPQTHVLLSGSLAVVVNEQTEKTRSPLRRGRNAVVQLF